MATTAKWTTLSFPFTLNGGTKLELDFVADATVGVVLQNLDSKDGATVTFPVGLQDVAERADLDGRLWEIYYARSGGAVESSPLTPADASSFEAWDISDQVAGAASGRAALFVWHGVAVPGTSDRLKVALRCWVLDDEEFARWQLIIDREFGNSISIEYYHAPILWCRGIAKTNAGDADTEAAQKRMRVLHPSNIFTSLPASYQNASLWDWCNVASSGEKRIRHPNPGQPMQFAAMMSANTDTDPAYLRVLHLGSNDTFGFIKEFVYEGYTHDDGGTARPYLKWSVRHYPPWVKQFAGRGQSQDLSSVSQGYHVLTGAYAAANEHWWWDVCDRYRTEMAASLPPLIEASTRLTNDLARKVTLFSQFIHQNTFNDPKLDLDAYIESMLRQHRNWLTLLKSAWVDAENSFIHTQTWLQREALLSVKNPSPKPDVTNQFKAELAKALTEGIRVSGYTESLSLATALGWSPPNDIVRVGRDGALAADPDGYVLDLHATAYGEFWASAITGAMRKVGLRGHYMDAYTGASAALSYGTNKGHDPQSSKQYVANKLAHLDLFRSTFQDPQAFLLSEAVEEGLSYALEVSQEGYHYIANSLELGEDGIWTAGTQGAVTAMAEGARNMTPPLLPAVYGGRIPIFNIQIPFSNAMLASNGDWNPSGGRNGLTDNQFVDLFCWHLAALWMTGTHAANITVQNDFVEGGTGGNELVQVDGGGNAKVDVSKDPNGVGLTVLAFLRRLVNADYRPHAGRFRRFGRLMRPLVVDHTTNNNVEATPMNAAFDQATGTFDYGIGDVNRIWAIPGSILALSDATKWAAYVNTAYDVPSVYHSMWLSADDAKVGLLLVNWTRASKSFFGTFDPTLYGIAGAYDVVKQTLGGSPSTLASGISGTKTLGNAGVPDVAIGTLPAHSVTLITFE